MTYVNYTSVTAVGVIFMVLGLLVIGLRIHLWARHEKQAHVDGVLAVPAVLLQCGAGLAIIVGAQKHWVGDHSPAETLSEFEGVYIPRERIEEFEFYLNLVFYAAVGFIKISILFYFRRLFKSHIYRSAFDVANWTLIAIAAAWSISLFIVQIFACGLTVDALWLSLAALHTSCVHEFATGTSAAVIDLVLDIAILVEPLVMIARLKHIARGSKIELSLMFLLAIGMVAVTMTRMILWIEISQDDLAHPKPRIIGLAGYDTIGVVSIFIFWAYRMYLSRNSLKNAKARLMSIVVEIGVGCIIACLLPCQRYFAGIRLAVHKTHELIPSTFRPKGLFESAQRSKSTEEFS